MMLCCVRVIAGKHVDLIAIENYLRRKKYPNDTSAKVDKANFRRACKKFNLVTGQMMYKGNRLLIIDEQRQRDIIHDAHQGLGDNDKVAALSLRLGRTSI